LDFRRDLPDQIAEVGDIDIPYEIDRYAHDLLGLDNAGKGTDLRLRAHGSSCQELDQEQCANASPMGGTTSGVGFPGAHRLLPSHLLVWRWPETGAARFRRPGEARSSGDSRS